MRVLDVMLPGLDSGADDYLPKPFSYPVLLAHLRSLTGPDSIAVEIADDGPGGGTRAVVTLSGTAGAGGETTVRSV
jgi:DNA-binding response OmpR family regulator